LAEPSSMTTAVISGVIGVTVASGIAVVKSAISSRSQANEELRSWRLKAYPEVWRLTSFVPRWPRADPTYRDLWIVHRVLRDWYYKTGGLYLSENSRARYGDIQELLDAYLVARASDDDTPREDVASSRVKHHHPYTALMETCSVFRTALTEDLATRRSRSILWAMVFWWRHRRDRARAVQRLEAAKHHQTVVNARAKSAKVPVGISS